VRRYVWIAFVISGLYGGVAGSLYAMVQQHVRPGPVLYFLRSGDILFMAILGGFQTLLGPLFGGVVLVVLQDVGRDLTNYFDALTGLVLLVIVFGMPRGIVGSLGAGGRLRRAFAAAADDPSVVGRWIADALRAVARALRAWLRHMKAIVGVR
jgi:branched-chain amino acid transport system permease protein